MTDPVRRRWAVLAVVSAAQFLAILDLWVVTIALPVLGRDFAPAPLPQVSWILNGYTIVVAAALVPAGQFADRYGRRRAFLAGLAAFGVASLGCALAPTLPVLVACRIAQAAGAAVLMPTSLGLALAVFPARQRGAAVGAWAAVGAVAAGGGPVLGGLLVASSWRWIFLLNVPLVAAALVAGAALLPRTDTVRPGRFDGRGVLLAVGAAGLTCTALTEAAAWPAALVWPLAVAGLALGAAFVVHVRRHPAPLVPPRLFAARPFTAAALGIAAYYLGFATLLLGTTLLLTGPGHLTALQAAAGIAPGPLVAGLVSPVTGRLLPRLGRRTATVVGAALFAAAGLVGLTAHPGYATAVLPAMVLWGLANGFLQPALFAGADAVPPDELAVGSAVLTTARQLGSAVGVALLVAVLGAHPGAFAYAWAVVIATALVTAATALAGRRTSSPGTRIRAHEGALR
ncbi:MAG TPA: MFS transporter [Actinocatenispora sp.]